MLGGGAMRTPEALQASEDVRARTATLEAENIKLRSFFREAISVSWEGEDWAGSDIQDKAEELGLGHFEADECSESIFVLDMPDGTA